MSKYEEIKRKIEAEAAGTPVARTQPVPCAFCKRGGNGDLSCSCGFFERRYSKFKGCFSGELLGHDPNEGGAFASAEQKALLAAAKSFDADVDRAKCISIISEKVLREMCKSCGQADECEKNLYGLPRLTCRMTAVAAVAVGMIGEKQEGGAK